MPVPKKKKGKRRGEPTDTVVHDGQRRTGGGFSWEANRYKRTPLEGGEANDTAFSCVQE